MSPNTCQSSVSPYRPPVGGLRPPSLPFFSILLALAVPVQSTRTNSSEVRPSLHPAPKGNQILAAL